MKIEKFKIIQFVRELILMIDKDMDNFPKKDIEIKNRIRKNSYDILELVYEANTAIEIEYKKNLLLKMLAKIKVVDFLLNLSYDKQIITAKKLLKKNSDLQEIIELTGLSKGEILKLKK